MTAHPPHVIERMLELTAEGFTSGRIAAELGVSIRSVQRARAAHGVAGTPTAAMVDDALVGMLTSEGCSTRRIAEIMHCSTRSVTRARSRLGIAKPPGRPVTAEERAIADAMLADGASVREIERTLGRQPSALAYRYRGKGWSRAQIVEYAVIRRQELRGRQRQA